MRRLRIGTALIVAATLVGCSGSPPETFDLSAVKPPYVAAARQIQVREPVTALDLDGQNILVRTGPQTLAKLAGAQWADRLPTLIRTRLVQTLENARMRVVDGAAAPDFALEIDVRAFELDATAKRVNADVAVKLVGIRGGRILATEIFTDSEAVNATDPATVCAALNRVLGRVMTRIAFFAARGR